MCPDLFPGCCSGGHAARTIRASILRDRSEPGLRVWECSTAERSATPPIHCAQHVQQSVDMSIQLPADLQCDPVQMAEVVEQVYVLIGRAWLYPRVNFANTVHLSKHHSYCLQSQISVSKDRPSERHLIADDRDK